MESVKGNAARAAQFQSGKGRGKERYNMGMEKVMISDKARMETGLAIAAKFAAVTDNEVNATSFREQQCADGKNVMACVFGEAGTARKRCEVWIDSKGRISAFVGKDTPFFQTVRGNKGRICNKGVERHVWFSTLDDVDELVQAVKAARAEAKKAAALRAKIEKAASKAATKGAEKAAARA